MTLKTLTAGMWALKEIKGKHWEFLWDFIVCLTCSFLSGAVLFCGSGSEAGNTTKLKTRKLKKTRQSTDEKL